jgi:spore germination cell wall hydrolase CwlJ-like protein
MMTFIRNALKALVVSALAVGVTDAALAAPFILTDAVEGGAPAARTERVRQRYAEDADLIFGLAYHVQPRGAFGKAARGARQARQYKFAASFPTVQPSQLSNELHCLALNIYHEARGESEQGKRAVGHVVMNRVTDRRFPTSVCRVVRQGGERRRNRCQFSWWCDGRSDRPRNRMAWKTSVEIALEIIAGMSSDPTGGALWYHADYVSPYWRKAFKRGPKIGQHIFYQARTARSL